MLNSLVLAIPLLLGAGAPRTSTQAIELVQGKSATVMVPFALGQGANSNPEVIQAVPDVGAKRITFFARKLGNASYTVFDAKDKKHRIDYEIRVVTVDLHDEAGKIRQIVPEGVTVSIVADRILVEGEVATPAEMDRVKVAIEGRSDAVKNLVRFSDAATKAAAKTIEQQINSR